MGHHVSDAFATGWFLAGVPAPAGEREEPDELPPTVIISVSLDELDGLSGDMLV